MPSLPDKQQTSPLAPLLPATGGRLVWTGLEGDSVALTLSSAAKACQGPLVVITEDTQQADLLAEQYMFYTGTGGTAPLTFPDWETLPYDSFSPHQDIISERLATLHRLPELGQGLLIIPVTTLQQRLPPRDYIFSNSLVVERGDEVDLEAFRQKLTVAGYHHVSQVLEHGEFAVRGSLLDLFPMGSEKPFRIEFFDREVESIRTFDPETQITVEQQDAINLLPAHEFPLDDDGRRRFRKQFRATFEGDPQRCTVYRAVTDGHAPAGIEYYLPLFFETTDTLFDYLPSDCTLVITDRTEVALEAFETQCAERYEARRHDSERPILPPEQLFLGREETVRAIQKHPLVEIGSFRNVPGRTGHADYAVTMPGDLRIRARSDKPADRLVEFIGSFPGKVLLTAESTGRRESLDEQLRSFGIRAKTMDGWEAFLAAGSSPGICVAPIENGMLVDAENIAVITETSLFGERARQTRRRRPARDPATIIRNLGDLEISAPVVHEEHGIGRYAGLEIIKTDGIDNEYLTLEYAGGDKLYVPVSSLQLISRYTGASPESAPLHRLGSDQWEKARKKAARRIRDVAAELLDVYARRAARQGHACTQPGEEYAAFAATFPFEETPDQELAINAVLDDMQSTTPMDRLVCGDVGFGKTEVAMRAAFMATLDGHQAAILVPTTLLAQQHYQNLLDRFSDWPVRIELLSRFRTSKQQESTLKAIEAGKVDIVVGTHKLIQAGVRFKNLGLLVIDEEHRFGVKQKEQIKSLRSEVDVLTLTATPIPRTLNMSLSGLRDLSIISTPPVERLAVKTFVCEWDKATIREACLREIKRGGQIYFLHNQVDTIERMAEEIAGIVPEASIGIAHGQMREQALEQVMLDFYHRRFNLLLCSTIIESGIDVPTANTIIINRADRLGLAQLHQLRGRVGRSHHRAYAYLIRPELRAMSGDAVKRLAVIESMEELGSGYTLAAHDLEIRGAGELLGEDQSGQIHEIGYALYNELLERAVHALREGRSPDLMQPMHRGPDIELSVPALLPDDFINDVHTRLVLYKRIAGAENKSTLESLQVEVIDRFGLLPEAAKNLFRIAALKLQAHALGIMKIECGSRGGRILFSDAPSINVGKLVEMVQQFPKIYRFEGGDRLKISANFPTETMRFDAISDILGLLKTAPDVRESVTDEKT